MAGASPTHSNEELAAAYGDLRERCLELGRSLTDAQADVVSACCPAWSVKDLYAHMAGVPVDILDRNVEGAATEAWADAHVERRRADALSAICDEWAATATPIDELICAVGSDLPPQFYIDAWTHEWDIRQAVAASASPDLRLPHQVAGFLLDAVARRADEREHSPITLTVQTPDGPLTAELGSGTPTSTVTIGLFDFSRVAMGRRSLDQVAELAPSIDPEAIVFWSPNDQRIIDPVA